MSSKEEILDILRDIKHKYDLPEVVLFGSYARGDATEKSDVDMAVRMKKTDVIVLTNILMEAEERLGKRVDIVQLRDSMNEFLKNQILTGGVHV